MAELKSILDQYPLTLLYLSTPSCNVCKVLRPQVEAHLTNAPLWNFQYINTEDSMEIAGQHLVFAVPTLLLFLEGREVARLSRHFGMHELETQIQHVTQIFNQA
ncbi:thioredoxin family protein [bacterium]|nr:thioredoxin family protein [bacterium]